jgi:integrase
MIEDFQKFLTKVRKKNGDKLLPITIEKYVYFVSSYIKKFEEFGDNFDELIIYMNKVIRQRPSIVIYSAFRMYLIFAGVDKKSSEIRNLQPPDKTANAFTSKRFLQSKVLSRGELKRLFNEVDDETKLIFSAMYDTACRRSELLNMKFSDVVFSKHKEDIKNNLYAEITVLGKGAKNRVVYFGKVTYDLLMKLRPSQNPDDFLFKFYKDKDKGILYARQEDELYKLIVKTSEDILGRRITPHCFRHTKLTHLADAGAEVMGLSRYAGHENISTTMIYVEISNRVGRLTYSNYSEDIVEEENENG